MSKAYDPKSGGQGEVYFKGTSMRGVFRPGDRLLIQPCSFEDVLPGDIIVFRQSDQDVVHRVIRHQGLQLITCGDSNPKEDPNAVQPDQLKGKVVRLNRQGKDLSLNHGAKGLRDWRRHQRLWQSIFKLNHLLNRFLAPGTLSWLYRITPQLLILKNLSEIKIVHKGKTIGRYNPDSGALHLRKPWSLFICRHFIKDRLKRSSSQ